MQASRTSRLTVTLTLSPLFFESFATSARSFDVRRTWTVASRRRACTSFGMSRQLTHTGSTINACAVRFRALGCGLSFRGHLTTSWARKSSARATARGPTPDASVFRKGFGGVLFYTEHRVCCQTHGMRHPRPRTTLTRSRCFCCQTHGMRHPRPQKIIATELSASCQTHGMRHPRPHGWSRCSRRVSCQTHGMRHPRPHRLLRVDISWSCQTHGMRHPRPRIPMRAPSGCQTHGMRHPRPLRHHARAGAIQSARCDGARVARAPGRE